MKKFLHLTAFLVSAGAALNFAACGQTPTPEAVVAADRYLYVVSGACFAGSSVATTTASNTIARYNLATGKLDAVLVDYNAFAPGDSPVGLIDYSATQLLVLVENTSGRRVDLVGKTPPNSVSTFVVNSTALSAVGRSIVATSDGGFLVSKSTAVEKFSSTKARVTQAGPTAFISAPGGTCATSTTNISSLTVASNGNIFFGHAVAAGASANNLIGIIKPTGYVAASDCVSAALAPGGATPTANPTHLILHSSGKLLVSYGSTTLGSNYIYSYTVGSGASSISGATAAYTDTSIVNGPSAMIEDPASGAVYVANAATGFNTIEKFTLNASGTLTREGTSPFIPSSVYTRCVSDLLVSSN